MKVIDLLNSIANEEDIPIKIKINGNLYRQANGQFWCDETEMYMIDNCTSIYNLNDEVEIIEDKKTEEIDEIEYYHQYDECWAKDKFYKDQKGNLVDEIIIDKVNEIIKVINEMRENE